jgi:hypothetical protein
MIVAVLGLPSVKLNDRFFSVRLIDSFTAIALSSRTATVKDCSFRLTQKEEVRLSRCNHFLRLHFHLGLNTARFSYVFLRFA